MTATATGDALFANYAGACNGAQPGCDVAMTEDRTVTATFVPFACEPNVTTCSQQTLVRCDANGMAHVSTCLFGCEPGGTRCYDLAPSNLGMTECLDGAAVEPDAGIPDGATINTDSGAITLAGGGTLAIPSETIEAPTDGVAVRCFRANNLTIGNVTVVGERALAIAANGTVTITGNLSVSARAFDTPGPGHLSRSSGCRGENGTNAGFFNLGGSGGAGFRGAGGRGGSGGPRAGGGAGGPANGNDELVPLRGGCSGGGAGFFQAGGAVQLASRVEIAVEGGITANGWGGGRPDISTPWGGASGGGVLLEAPLVRLRKQGLLVANGGGGGGVTPGEPGGLTTLGAMGGPGEAATGRGAGGLGGAVLNARFGDDSAGVGVGGGGGGSSGRVRVNSYRAFVPDDGAIMSPVVVAGSVGRR